MALALDGVATSAVNITPSVTLTTTQAGTIVVVIANEGVDNANPCPTVASVTASGLTFTRRGGANLLNYGSNFGISVPENAEIWWAPSSGAVTSKVISVTWSGTIDDMCICAFGVSGSYDAVSPWDANVSLPGFNTSSSTTVVPTKPTYSTTATNTFIFALASGLTTTTPTSAWTTIATLANNGGGRSCALGVFYQIVSSAQTSQQPSLTQTQQAAIFGVDALKAGSTAETSTAALSFAGVAFSASSTHNETSTASLHFSGVSFAAHSGLMETGAGALHFSGIAMHGLGGRLESGAGALNFGGIGIRSVVFDLAPAASGVTNFWTFGA